MSSKRPVTRLAPDARAALLSYGARATWPGGFAIYQRAQPADGVFVVLSGRVVLRSRVKAGRGFVPVVAAEGRDVRGRGADPRQQLRHRRARRGAERDAPPQRLAAA